MQKTIHKITVANEFSDTPGPRSKEEGDFSGEDFLERLLFPAYRQVIAEDTTLLIDLDEAKDTQRRSLRRLSVV